MDRGLWETDNTSGAADWLQRSKQHANRFAGWHGVATNLAINFILAQIFPNQFRRQNWTTCCIELVTESPTDIQVIIHGKSMNAREFVASLGTVPMKQTPWYSNK
jgi:hypothetical protein